jgi:hypothetical protein
MALRGEMTISTPQGHHSTSAWIKPRASYRSIIFADTKADAKLGNAFRSWPSTSLRYAWGFAFGRPLRASAAGAPEANRRSPSPERFQEIIVTDVSYCSASVTDASNAGLSGPFAALRSYALSRTSCLPLKTDSP